MAFNLGFNSRPPDPNRLIWPIIYGSYLSICFRHQEKIDKQQRAVKEILITFGFNDSDNTVGWKLYKNAMTMYYLHPTQKFIQEEHSFPLVPGLKRV